MIFRPLAFIAIIILSVFVTPIIALPIGFWYALRWFAPEIIILGFIIDSFFGGASSLPFYTAAALIVVISAEFAKASLMLKWSN